MVKAASGRKPMGRLEPKPRFDDVYTEGGKNNLTSDQYFWLLAFHEVGAETYVWREGDDDWEEMVRVLS